VKVWTEPQVTVVGSSAFIEPEHMRVDWVGDELVWESQRLIEFAGRLCYMSQANPGRKSTKMYIGHLLEAGHGSVLEHASVSLLIEGVSRALSHELIRHRAGTAVSQVSQRFVEGDVEVRCPPAIVGAPELRADWEADAQRAVSLWLSQLKRMRAVGLRGKPLREAARALLPNCTETKLVFTANLRAWRHIVAARGNKDADAEMQRLVAVVLPLLRAEAPAVFQDFSSAVTPYEPRNHKV